MIKRSRGKSININIIQQDIFFLLAVEADLKKGRVCHGFMVVKRPVMMHFNSYSCMKFPRSFSGHTLGDRKDANLRNERASCTWGESQDFEKIFFLHSPRPILVCAQRASFHNMNNVLIFPSLASTKKAASNREWAHFPSKLWPKSRGMSCTRMHLPYFLRLTNGA